MEVAWSGGASKRGTQAQFSRMHQNWSGMQRRIRAMLGLWEEEQHIAQGLHKRDLYGSRRLFG